VADGVGLTVALGVAETDCVEDGVPLAVALTVTDGVALTDLVSEGVGVADGLGKRLRYMWLIWKTPTLFTEAPCRNRILTFPAEK
jgi:hypothetical protein